MKKVQASVYRKRLIAAVVENSIADSWDEAVYEWLIIDCEEDSELSSSCICGKEKLRYLYTIENCYNGNVLFPIGSSCIKSFERSDLNEKLDITEKMFKLLNALKANKFITLSSDLFSRKLIIYLYENCVFGTDYNGFDGYNDYKFMMKMFNKRKDNITNRQKAKISAIILNSIFPYLKSILKIKL